MGTEVPRVRSGTDDRAAALFGEEQLGLLEALLFLFGCFDQLEREVRPAHLQSLTFSVCLTPR